MIKIYLTLFLNFSNKKIKLNIYKLSFTWGKYSYFIKKIHTNMCTQTKVDSAVWWTSLRCKTKLQVTPSIDLNTVKNGILFS